MALKILVFSCVGVAMEVVFTALTELPKARDWKLQGYSYIWMFPIYALVPMFLGPLRARIGGWPLPGRLALYVGLLYAVEYLSGWLLRKTTGSCPWERNYRGSRWSVHDLIRLDYFPAWALACFIFERLYLSLSVL